MVKIQWTGTDVNNKEKNIMRLPKFGTICQSWQITDGKNVNMKKIYKKEENKW